MSPEEITRKIESSSNHCTRLWPGLLTTALILGALTGNCNTCGYERDYLGEMIEASAER